MSDISDDTNFIYILSAHKTQQEIRKIDRKKTLKQTKHQTKSHFVKNNKHTSHVTKAAGIEVFMIQKNESALEGTNKSFSSGSFPKIRIDPRALL